MFEGVDKAQLTLTSCSPWYADGQELGADPSDPLGGSSGNITKYKLSLASRMAARIGSAAGMTTGISSAAKQSSQARQAPR